MSENETASQFTDQLLSKKILTCVWCKNLLNPPIDLIKHIGNVCRTCRPNYLSTQVIHNIQLEKILIELTLPCKYQTGGCVNRIPFADLREHEANCSHLTKPCLLEHEGCGWIGSQSELFTHFAYIHSDHVLTSGSNKFDIKLKLSEPIITTLLKGRAEHLLLVRKNDAANSLKYSLLGPQNGRSACAIRLVGRNGHCVEVGDGFELDIDALRRITAAEVVMGKTDLFKEQEQLFRFFLKNSIKEQAEDEIQLQIDAGGERAPFDEKMLQTFECPVCNSLMRPPIYQCQEGHSFCNVCKPKLGKCPTCRAPFAATRNYALEGLTVAVPYGCMYGHLGCEKLLHASDVDKHEAFCPCKPFACFFEECSFKGSRNNFGTHMEEAHGDKLIKSNYFKTTVKIQSENLQKFHHFSNKYYFMFNDNIFRLSFMRNIKFCYWAVEVLKQEENQHFSYEIGVIDMRKKDRKYIQTDSCLTDKNQDDLFKKCIYFSNYMLDLYSCNAFLSFYCQINN